MAFSVLRTLFLVVAVAIAASNGQDVAAQTEDVAVTSPKPSKEELKQAAKEKEKELRKEEERRKEKEAKADAKKAEFRLQAAQASANEALQNLTKITQSLEKQGMEKRDVGKKLKELTTQVNEKAHKDEVALKADFSSALDDLKAAVALGNSSHVLKKLAKKCDAISDDIKHLEKKKGKHLRKMLREEAKDTRKEIHSLAKAVERASRAALKSSRKAESAALKAGARESEAEGHLEEVERSMEALAGDGERLEDLSENLLEEFYGRVRDEVEDQSDDLKDLAKMHAEQREKQVNELLKQAKASEDSSKGPDAEAPEAEAESTFLRESTQPLNMALATLAMLTMLAMGLVLSRTNRREFKQQPILG